MDIRSWTDAQLANLENNYLAKGAEVGGKFSLAEVRLEKLRRQPSTLNTVAVARRIVELSKASEDGLTTYGDLWSFFYPETEWKGNASVKIISNALSRVLAYCIVNNLPIMTTLVVRGNRQLSNEAIANMYEQAKSLGVPTGVDPVAFVTSQQRAALALCDFPSEITE